MSKFVYSSDVALSTTFHSTPPLQLSLVFSAAQRIALFDVLAVDIFESFKALGLRYRLLRTRPLKGSAAEALCQAHYTNVQGISLTNCREYPE